jgi:hypothetical protein
MMPAQARRTFVEVAARATTVTRKGAGQASLGFVKLRLADKMNFFLDKPVELC